MHCRDTEKATYTAEWQELRMPLPLGSASLCNFAVCNLTDIDLRGAY